MVRYMAIATFVGIIGLAHRYVGPEIGIGLLAGVVGGLAWDFIERERAQK